jgi:hypothetical protein
MHSYFKYCILLLLFASSHIAAGQVMQYDESMFCSKKWTIEKYQEVSGESFQPPKENKNDYLIFHCDGIFESREAGVIIKGNWVFDTKSKTIRVTQNQTRDFPLKSTIQLKKLTTFNMIIESQDAGGDNLTIFMKVIK